MRNDQIKIKYVKHNKSGREWLYPKSYIFKLTPKDKKEFKDQLQKGKKGLIEIPKLKGAGTVKVLFMIEEIGHFDDELHKPLMIVKMFDE